MNLQEVASFPSSKPNYLHKRRSYDRITAIYPRAAGGVEHNYDQYIRSHFMFRF